MTNSLQRSRGFIKVGWFFNENAGLTYLDPKINLFGGRRRRIRKIEIHTYNTFSVRR